MQSQPTYLKALTVRDVSDIHQIREDLQRGMVLILRVTPLANKDTDKLRTLVTDLHAAAKENDCDIARLGEERIIVTPSRIKIWKPDYELK